MTLGKLLFLKVAQTTLKGGSLVLSHPATSIAVLALSFEAAVDRAFHASILRGGDRASIAAPATSVVWELHVVSTLAITSHGLVPNVLTLVFVTRD